MVNLVRRREWFVGLSILLVCGRKTATAFLPEEGRKGGKELKQTV